MKIAIAGKGGTGKTTITGMLARTIAQRGHRIWAIDADSNPNLALTLGVPRSRAADVQPLPRTILQERTDESGQKQLVLGTPPAEVARQFGTPVTDEITLMLMGHVDHAGAG